MGKKKNKAKNYAKNVAKIPQYRLWSKKIPDSEVNLFERSPRGKFCWSEPGGERNDGVVRLDHDELMQVLTYDCDTIEDQFLEIANMAFSDLEGRRRFTQQILDCLYTHHKVPYQGILYGSSINGLGFPGSDIDLRLRPLRQISPNELEPIVYHNEMVERVLRNIAHQTTRCKLAEGNFVPSTRCPLAKLIFLSGDRYVRSSLQELWHYDISLSTHPLGNINSLYMRFLCHLEPKFHALALTLKYWANEHCLIQQGRLSSYALINLMIFFLQNVEPPLLPTVDKMRAKFLDRNDTRLKNTASQSAPNIAISKLEWECLIDLDKTSYEPSKNNEPLCLLLLKFFEFYLKFPFGQHIITIRTGKAIEPELFDKSTTYNKFFKMKPFMNIQDPFDLPHNLTAGMDGRHFMLFLGTIKCSYERLADEISQNFLRPYKVDQQLDVWIKRKQNIPNIVPVHLPWGLGHLLKKMSHEERKIT